MKIKENILQLRTSYSEKDRCTSIKGGRWNPHQHVWEYLLTPATAQQVLTMFEKDMQEDIKEYLRTLASRMIVHQLIVNGSITNLEVPISKTVPWKHQITAYNLLLNLLGLKKFT